MRRALLIALLVLLSSARGLSHFARAPAEANLDATDRSYVESDFIAALTSDEAYLNAYAYAARLSPEGKIELVQALPQLWRAGRLSNSAREWAMGAFEPLLKIGPAQIPNLQDFFVEVFSLAVHDPAASVRHGAVKQTIEMARAVQSPTAFRALLKITQDRTLALETRAEVAEGVVSVSRAVFAPHAHSNVFFTREVLNSMFEVERRLSNSQSFEDRILSLVWAYLPTESDHHILLNIQAGMASADPVVRRVAMRGFNAKWGFPRGPKNFNRLELAANLQLVEEELSSAQDRAALNDLRLQAIADPDALVKSEGMRSLIGAAALEPQARQLARRLLTQSENSIQWHAAAEWVATQRDADDELITLAWGLPSREVKLEILEGLGHQSLHSSAVKAILLDALRAQTLKLPAIQALTRNPGLAPEIRAVLKSYSARGDERLSQMLSAADEQERDQLIARDRVLLDAIAEQLHQIVQIGFRPAGLALCTNSLKVLVSDAP